MRKVLPIAVAVAGLSLPTAALAVAPNNTIANSVNAPIGINAISVGQVVACNKGTWDDPGVPSAYTYSYQWKRDNAGTDIVGATADNYLVTVNDSGHTLGCAVTATNSGLESATVTSAFTGPNSVGPTPTTAEYSQFSGTVSLTNFAFGDQSMTYSLVRNGLTVASSTQSTSGGSATFTLSNGRAPEDARDSLNLAIPAFTFSSSLQAFAADSNSFFGPGGPIGTTTLTPTASPDGSTITVGSCPSCSRAQLTITRANGTTSGPVDLHRDPTDNCSGFTGDSSCTYTSTSALPGGALALGDKYKVRIGKDGQNGRTVENVAGALAGQSAPPTCSANTTLATVTCSHLPAVGNYSLTHSGGGAQPSGPAPGGSFTGTFTALGLKSGDTVALKGQGATSPLTILKVGALQADVVDGQSASVACTAGEWLADVSGQGFNIPCSLGGTSATVPFPISNAFVYSLDDDSSGGSTRISIPQVVNGSPLYNESMAPTFVAYGESGDAATWPIELKIAALATPTTFIRTLANVNVASGVALTPALAPGRYATRWALTTTHVGNASAHDSYVENGRVVIQASQAGTNGTNGNDGAAGGTGPGGAAGAAGPAGPAGAPGASGREVKSVTCKLKKKTKISCQVTYGAAARAARVSVRLSRHGQPAVSGSGMGGHAIHLRSTHRLSRGTYSITLVIAGRTYHGKVRVH
jgi:hypothetical protein